MQSANFNNTSAFNNKQFSLSICNSIGELKNPHLATPASLKASLAAVITTGAACPFAVVLNSLVLLAFYKKPSLRTQSNVMIGIMAANDLVKAGIGGAFFISKEINYQMEHDPKCPVLVGLALSASIVSDIIVAGMNLEKYVALQFPYWHRVNVTARRILTTALVSILTGFLLTVIRVFSEAGRFLVVLPFAICIISTSIFAVSIWRVISKRNRQIQAQSEQANVTTLTSSERKAAKMATYIAVGLLFTSIIPLLLLTMVSDVH
ncbi:hypothetical protein AC249_AIPGENE6486 [Exaiptasia diaphana]|nr:hypothetical protein AC249_AIPGENE6486 [Exaiptasia diaphana]